MVMSAQRDVDFRLARCAPQALSLLEQQRS